MKPMKEWKKKSKIWISMLILFALVVSITFGYYIYKINSTLETMYQPVKRLDAKIEKISRATGVKTYLILGTDQRPGDKGRTDGIIIAVVNDFTKKITLTSIPRDTYVEIAGLGHEDKINTAYPYEGISGSIATVENFTGIPIDNYIWFNMQGFEKAVDAIGGLRLNVDHNVAFKEHLPEGDNQLLTGAQALTFTRFRHDIKGDFGRNDRQQEALKAFLDQSKEIR